MKFELRDVVTPNTTVFWLDKNEHGDIFLQCGKRDTSYSVLGIRSDTGKLSLYSSLSAALGLALDGAGQILIDHGNATNAVKDCNEPNPNGAPPPEEVKASQEYERRKNVS